MIHIRIEIWNLSATTQEAIISNLERIGVRYDVNIVDGGNYILVTVDEPLQMQKLTSFLLANPIQYSFVNPSYLPDVMEYPSYGITLPARDAEEALEQIKLPWSRIHDPVTYLRKLMVEHYGLSVNNPLEVDELWQKGYNPPLPPRS